MFSTRGRPRSWERPAFLFLVPLFVAACGGGGGGGSMTSNTTPPTISLSAQPTTVVAGQAVTLTWMSNASGCTASGAWSGAQQPAGNLVVNPTTAGTANYTLTCTAPASTVTAATTATVTVNPASTFSITALVSDTPGMGAQTVDPNLVNPWGIVFGAGTPVWISNNHSGTSTLYDGNGKPQPAATPLIVNLPNGLDPTGIVFNATTDFAVHNTTTQGVGRFIFSGEGGMIAGWAPNVDLHNAIAMYTDTGGAIYKGLAEANNGTANFLYATDFHNNKIDMFDATYTRQTLGANKFVDANLPAGYAPFGIQAIKNGAGSTWQLYVTYAMQQGPDNEDDAPGAGLGIVDIYDPTGTFVKRLVSPGGALNAPWGLALAPANLGTLSNALLVGNFGDGKINGYDPTSGQWIGAIIDSTGAAFVSPGLWGIAFGNGAANQPTNTLFYAAGPNDEANGVYGRIDLGGPPTLNAPPVVTLTVPAATLTGTVTLSATAQDPIAIAKIQFFNNTNTLIGTATTAPYSVQWDTTTVANGAVSITAVATDNDGAVGTSTATAATVNN
jgi:uncharacterized protein (TIGR03118 family)